jgi:hypothetical protein
MNALVVPRRANGQLAPGARLNPLGRPVSAIAEVRALLDARASEIVDVLFELLNSRDEKIRLGAISLAFDRWLGKPAPAIDDNSASDAGVAEAIQKLYLTALIGANAAPRPPDPTTIDAHEW